MRIEDRKALVKGCCHKTFIRRKEWSINCLILKIFAYPVIRGIQPDKRPIIFIFIHKYKILAFLACFEAF